MLDMFYATVAVTLFAVCVGQYSADTTLPPHSFVSSLSLFSGWFRVT